MFSNGRRTNPFRWRFSAQVVLITGNLVLLRLFLESLTALAIIGYKF